MYNYIYIKIFKDKLSITTNKLNHFVDVTPKTIYSNSRLLIANIDNAVSAIKKALKELNIKKSFFKANVFIIQPKDYIFDDFSQVEERILLEISFKSGANDAYVYLGNDLENSSLNNELRIKLQQSNNCIT